MIELINGGKKVFFLKQLKHLFAHLSPKQQINSNYKVAIWQKVLFMSLCYSYIHDSFACNLVAICFREEIVPTFLIMSRYN